MKFREKQPNFWFKRVEQPSRLLRSSFCRSLILSLHITMALAYQTVKSDDVELKKMESELQAAILTNGYISVDAVKGLVTYGIVTCDKFHILGTKDNIPHSQLLLGTSFCMS